jgi:DNA-directed RNA polymerase I subunit RPA1
MENIKIEYDGTVRNVSDGRIIQFVYGDDGCDGVHTEHIRCDLCLSEMCWDEDELSASERALYQSEKLRLEDAQTLLRPFSGKTIDLLVDPERVFARSSERASGIRATEALEWVSSLNKSLKSFENPLLEAVLAAKYSSKRITGVHSLDRLEEFKATLLHDIRNHMVHPGEMVGVVAAQSIAE